MRMTWDARRPGRTSTTALSAALLAACVGAGLLVAPLPAQASPSGDPDPTVHEMEAEGQAEGPDSVAEGERVSASGSAVACSPPAKTAVTDGEPIVVSLAPAEPFTVGQIPADVWRNPWVKDPSWRLTFEGLRWTPPLAQRAHDDGQRAALDVIVAQAAAFTDQNPDPGTATYGWDEGTALRRLEALNCLYELTRDPRLVKGMKAAAEVLLGPRYYGPPNYHVHNHGVMANLRLVKAAELLGIPEWRTKALQRMESEAPLVFSPKGTTWEQSTTYQSVNVVLWDEAADALAPSRTTDVIRAHTTRGRDVYRWMTEPDGLVTQIGNSDKHKGDPTPSAGASFRDDDAGWIMGRFSWKDPATTHYSVRYGPPRRAHGHQDRGGVTWSADTVRVLVGPGRYTYDATNPWYAYQIGGTSHNVAIPDGGTLDSRAAATVRGGTVQAAAHAWSVDDAIYGKAHNRTVNVNKTTQTLKVTDSFEAGVLFRQYWNLDPAWALSARSSDGTQLRFTHPGGRTLELTTTGQVSSVLRGSTSPRAGWSFPVFGTMTPAHHVTVRGYGTTETTFVLRTGTDVPTCKVGSPDCPVDRIAGSDRYATAVAIGRQSAPTSTTAVIAGGAQQSLVDGLVAAPLARRMGAPLLLSAPEVVPKLVLDELQRRGTQRALLVGGEGALASDVVATLEARGMQVERIAGADRYQTARLVAERLRTEHGSELPGAFLASGANPNLVDALGAGGAAAYARRAVVLTRPDALSPEAASALTAVRSSTRAPVDIVGGTGAVSAAVESAVREAGHPVRRLAGSNRYATAARVATAYAAALGTDGHLVVSSGASGNLVDGMPGGTLARPMLLTSRDQVPTATSEFAQRSDARRALVLGGEGAVGQYAVDALGQALR